MDNSSPKDQGFSYQFLQYFYIYVRFSIVMFENMLNGI